MYVEGCPYCDEEEPEMCPLHGVDNEDEDRYDYGEDDDWEEGQ